MIVIGIDPGLDGAIAALLPTGLGFTLRIVDMPVIKAGKKRKTDIPELARLLANYAPGATHFGVELAHSYPHQGVASCFSFGHGLGVIEGILGALGHSYELVSPQRWRRVMLADFQAAATPAERKAQSVQAARRLFPQGQFVGPRGGALDGRADATLLAEYQRRALGGAASSNVSPRPALRDVTDLPK
jgi:crossover junction endodeoxyribonuclease RuvC